MAESVQIGTAAGTDIMTVLQRQGVTDLNSLVEKGLAAAKAAAVAGQAKGTGCCFICKGYIYIVLE
jgi:hypothetical protein